nr:putative reverse transcriptase domain-containing protein [Tanacetum cinerariifolium]
PRSENSEDEETPPTSLIIPDADGQHIPPIASFGQNFHFSESSSTANLLTGNSKIVSTGPMINTEGRIKKKFREQDRYFLGLCCDNIEMDMTVRKVMSDLSGLKKDTAIADAAKATSGIDDDDDDDTAPMDSQTMPPRKSTRGNPPPPLTHDTMNRMIQESVEAAIRAERERVQNEANRAEGPNVAPVARELSCMKVKKYVDRGSYFFVAQVVEKEPAERRLEDVPVIYKFLDVFPEDLPGLPPPRQVEFEIELVPGAASVVRAPYRLAPSEIKELAKKL